MNTARLQLGLIATLAVGLGLSLSSSNAIGYPSAASVSLGSNPVWSSGGTPIEGSLIVATATGGDLIITDIDITGTEGNDYFSKFTLTDGTVLAEYRMNDAKGLGLHRSYQSGIRVPEGDNLILIFDSYYSESAFRYTLSGYTAQP